MLIWFDISDRAWTPAAKVEGEGDDQHRIRLHTFQIKYQGCVRATLTGQTVRLESGREFELSGNSG